ncbi:hypothetical protein HMPREF1495_0734 [Lachnoanaerobaculum sp. MSX33]|nr:hypothetical protein HMPREF1495_0734 [Lachnoanaerobaculum sp. MSX33]
MNCIWEIVLKAKKNGYKLEVNPLYRFSNELIRFNKTLLF